jgi:hypothetical protein
MTARKEGMVPKPVPCKTCGHTPIVRIVEWVKCKECDLLFGRTKTGLGWKLERSLHMFYRHGKQLETELENIE